MTIEGSRLSVGRFRVEVSFQVSVTKFDHNIKEGKGFLRFFSSEVDGLMSGITLGNEIVQLLFSMCPEQEHIVNVADPNQGRLRSRS